MPQVSFYQLSVAPVEKVLPKLLEKILAAGQRAVVVTEYHEQVEFLNDKLWTYEQLAFLPHGSARDGNAEKQPIWITCDDQDNPNGAKVLVMTYNAVANDVRAYDKVVEIFDGEDSKSFALAKERINDYTNNMYELIYWKQDSKGQWGQMDLNLL